MIGRSFRSFDRRGRAVGFDLVFEGAHLRRAGGQDQVLVADGVDHIAGRQPLGLQRVQVQVDLHLALLAAVGVGNGGAVDGDQLGADEVQAVVVELLLGEPLPGEAKLQDGNARGVVSR